MGHGHSSQTGKEPTQDYSPELGHKQPLALYRKVYFTLLFLTALTVGAAFIDFGISDLVIAMVIASIKATLVALFFMHLKYESPFTWLYAAVPILILFFLLGGVFIDSPFRGHPEHNTPYFQTEK